MTKAINKTLTVLLIIAGGLVSSCINDKVENTSPTSSTNSVTVKFYIGGNEYNTVKTKSAAKSRATEEGVDTLNENTIQRLDLFIINPDGQKIDYHHTIKSDNPPGEDIYKYDATTQSGSWLLPGLKQADVAGKKVYLTANWNDADNVTSFNDLKTATTTGFYSPATKQTTFLMDGKGEEWKTVDTDKSYVVEVGLRRALSKIRLTLHDAAGKDITNNQAIAYQIVHYGTNAAVLAESEDSTSTLLASLPEEKDFNYGDGMLSFGKILHQNNKVIFYTYPNNWWNGKFNPYVEEPVNSDRQTYILLKAPYNGTIGYYKIPVNSRLPENNDKDLTDEEWKPILAGLYNISRNTIYDVTVNIDRPGGDIEKPVVLSLQYVVDDWGNGGDNEVEFD